jgi:hypothetical protein
MVDEKNIRNIENWQIHFAFLDEDMSAAAPIIQGEVNGRKIKNDLLLWFDPENGLAMTQKEVFKIGEPNERWLMMFLSSGRSIDDLAIVGTNH